VTNPENGAVGKRVVIPHPVTASSLPMTQDDDHHTGAANHAGVYLR